MPPQSGRWGRIIAITRLATGLVLFFYVLTHNLNHALGLISLAAMEAGRVAFLAFWRFAPVEIALFTAILLHFLIALRALYRRKSLRMPALEAAQLILGFSAPPLLILHVLANAYGNAVFGVDDRYAYVLWVIWVAAPLNGVLQAAAVIVTWVHGCIGLHYWLRVKPWFPRWRQALAAAALLIPVLALLGFADGAREAARLAADPAWLPQLLADINAPDEAEVAQIYRLRDGFMAGFGALLLGVFVLRGLRSLATRHRTIMVTYPDGKRVVIQPGTTLLEASRIGNIPHASVCGGRSRCSTCRVHVLAGAETLPPPSEEERRVLARIHAAPSVRLACQVRPGAAVTVQPLMPPGVSAQHALSGADLSQGKEQEVAILFADLRGFTGIAEQRLPYDVVFLLNQYFRATGTAIQEAGGHVDKFIGDGVMAVFGLRGRPDLAAAQALDAARRMARSLEVFNAQHAAELRTPLKVGIGVHFGPAIVGEMGFAPTLALTAIGDTVNIASRLEAATKEVGCQLLVSEAAAVAADMNVALGRRSEIALRGRKEPLIAYALDDARSLGA